MKLPPLVPPIPTPFGPPMVPRSNYENKARTQQRFRATEASQKAIKAIPKWVEDTELAAMVPPFSLRGLNTIA